MTTFSPLFGPINMDLGGFDIEINVESSKIAEEGRR
jgi:hypothetical protein